MATVAVEVATMTALLMLIVPSVVLLALGVDLGALAAWLRGMTE
jgi:hypothetical protein